MKLQAVSPMLLKQVATRHENVLLVGGTTDARLGVAKQILRLMPPLTEIGMEELCGNYGIAGLSKDFVKQRPLRIPHSSISTQGLCGHKLLTMPGEVALAHAGVLLLDNITKFRKVALIALSQVEKSGQSTVMKEGKVHFLPSRFLLVAGAETIAGKQSVEWTAIFESLRIGIVFNIPTPNKIV